MKMKRTLGSLCALGVLLGLGAVAAPAARRSFQAIYVGTIAAMPEGAQHAEIWIPIPSDGPYQVVTDVVVAGPAEHTFGTDSAGNRVAHFSVDGLVLKKEIEVRAAYRIARSEASAAAGPAPAAADLAENRLVPLSPRVRTLSKDLSAGKADAMAKARAFYDYLVDNGTYDKTTPGWGRGDSERFCEVKKGNCTDFHSAFLALARAQKIPARFVIGFPLKEEASGTVPGYHCWALFHVAGKGWIPVDASDAAKLKDPARKAYLFGKLDSDRFDVSSGRDLTLSPPQKGGPVNFLIAPYVEVDGKPFTETKMSVEYKNL